MIAEFGMPASIVPAAVHDFHPALSLDGKHNFKSTFRIARDGSISQLVRLHVPNKRIREEIICKHFLSSYVRWILRQRVFVSFLSRDDPWDFRIDLDIGKTFNVEITSLANDPQQFTQLSSEHRFALAAAQETVPLSLLRKLHRDYPSEKSAQIIKEAVTGGIGPNADVINPWFGKMAPVSVNLAAYDTMNLLDKISRVIRKKAIKKHNDKADTILIIDNQSTAYGVDDLHSAAAGFKDLRSNQFAEVWFYTGYYSDLDAGNAEWSLAPVQIPETTAERLRLAREEQGVHPNASGFVFGGLRGS